VKVIRRCRAECSPVGVAEWRLRPEAGYRLGWVPGGHWKKTVGEERFRLRAACQQRAGVISPRVRPFAGYDDVLRLINRPPTSMSARRRKPPPEGLFCPLCHDKSDDISRCGQPERIAYGRADREAPWPGRAKRLLVHSGEGRTRSTRVHRKWGGPLRTPDRHQYKGCLCCPCTGNDLWPGPHARTTRTSVLLFLPPPSLSH